MVCLHEKKSNGSTENVRSNTTAEEHEIDRLVYQFYGLTEEEVAIVEGANS